LPTYRNQNIG